MLRKNRLSNRLGRPLHVHLSYDAMKHKNLVVRVTHLAPGELLPLLQMKGAEMRVGPLPPPTPPPRDCDLAASLMLSYMRSQSSGVPPSPHPATSTAAGIGWGYCSEISKPRWTNCRQKGNHQSDLRMRGDGVQEEGGGGM